MNAIPQSTRMILLLTALGFMLLEYALGRLAHRDTHDLRETATSVAIAIGQHLMRAAMAVIAAFPFVVAYRHRLFDFDQSRPLTLLGLFFASEFFYYWHHRASHRIRWFWATHAVHHSSTRLNLTAAIRLGWTGEISGHFVFYLPLALLCFHPLAIVGMLGLNLLYQFFVHTELAPRLGLLEHVLNTPAHHRVHHASNEACRDRNYGGVLIIFDRMFGTFAEAPADEPLRYGLVGVAPSFNPFRIAMQEWLAMAREVTTASTWAGRLRLLVAAPGDAHARSAHELSSRQQETCS